MPETAGVAAPTGGTHFERMTIQRMERVGIVVDDLAATTAIFIFERAERIG